MHGGVIHEGRYTQSITVWLYSKWLYSRLARDGFSFKK